MAKRFHLSLPFEVAEHVPEASSAARQASCSALGVKGSTMAWVQRWSGASWFKFGDAEDAVPADTDQSCAAPFEQGRARPANTGGGPKEEQTVSAAALRDPKGPAKRKHREHA